MSDNLDELLQTFGRESDEEKQQNFEQSTAKLIAKQLGCAMSEFPDSNWCDWLEDLDLIPGRIFCQRVFTFHFEELLIKPNNHPIVKAFKDLGVTDDDVTWVFKVYGYGRMVCTTIEPDPDTPCARVPNPLDKQKPLYIIPFSGYFTRFADQ
jgi:hypothetical protein